MTRSDILLEQLQENVERIDGIKNKITNLEEVGKDYMLTKQEQENLNSYYRTEFSLYMDNSSIFDEIEEEVRGEDEFTRRYILNKAEKLLRVARVDIGGNHA